MIDQEDVARRWLSKRWQFPRDKLHLLDGTYALACATFTVAWIRFKKTLRKELFWWL